jgi:hypothetical protein
MSRHRSPRGRRRAPDALGPQAARLRSVKVGLAAIAAGALVVAGTALVSAGRSGQFGPTDDAGRNTALAAPQPNPAPVVPAVPPVPDTAASAAQAAKEQAQKLAEAAKKQHADDDDSSGAAGCATRATTATALTQALADAKPGEKICAVGNMASTRLTISRGGTPSAPLQVIGSGSTPINGITVEASNVVVSGFSSVGAKAPGIELTGNNITVSHNTVKHPVGGDYDGLRFFGNNLKILDNTISDISPDGSGAHADCMQTFASDTPTSHNVLISGNSCQRIDNQCLIAEGPNDGEGDGKGSTSDITFVNNVCEAHASQALMIEDVKDMVVRGNSISGSEDKAFAFDIGSTGAKVSGNKIAADIGYEVGMDSSSRDGYQGPLIGGEP